MTLAFWMEKEAKVGDDEVGLAIAVDVRHRHRGGIGAGVDGLRRPEGAVSLAWKDNEGIPRWRFGLVVFRTQFPYSESPRMTSAWPVLRM
jgi:hypothetical protein